MLKNVKKVGSYIADVSALLPEWLSNGLVTLLSTFLILMSPMAVHGLDGPGRWKNYSWLGIVIVLLMVLLLTRYMTKENTPKMIRWSIVIPALLFVGSMFVSECLVPKVRPVYQGVSWCYLAYILLGSIIGHSDRMQEVFWDDFMCGVGLSFVISVVFCFMHRPLIIGFGYFGTYPNPNPFGIYLVLVIVAAIWNMHQIVYEGKKKYAMSFWMAAVILALFFVVKSGSRSALMSSAVLLAVWPLSAMFGQGTWKETWRRGARLVSVCITLLVFTVVAYPFLNDMLDTIPRKVNHPILTKMDPDDYQTLVKELGEQLKIEEDCLGEEPIRMVKMSAGGEAPEEEDVSAIARLLETFQKDGLEAVLGLRGRIYQYGIDHMDWRGHENGSYYDEEIDYNSAHMHNGAIQYGYVYGYVCVISYVLLLLAQSIVTLCRPKKISAGHLICVLIVVGYFFSYLFEAGGTVVRDVALVPYLLVTGQMIWKVGFERYRTQ